MSLGIRHQYVFSLACMQATNHQILTMEEYPVTNEKGWNHLDFYFPDFKWGFVMALGLARRRLAPGRRHGGNKRSGAKDAGASRRDEGRRGVDRRRGVGARDETKTKTAKGQDNLYC